MRFLTRLRLRLRSIFLRGRVEDELGEELRYHLERQIDEGIAVGMTKEEARYSALASVRDVEQRKEECRDVTGLNMIEHVVQDFRYALRQIRTNRAFACAAVFVLGLGISVAVTIFGFVYAALIKPLPYRDQSQLVGVFESSATDTRSIVSYLNFVDWKRLNHVFISIDAFALNGGFTLTTRNGAEQVSGTRVSAGFFHTLGIAPALGRDFRPSEVQPGAPHTIILTYSAWQKRFAGNSGAIGTSVTVNGVPTTIIGVLPKEFHFALFPGAEFWGTLSASDSCEQHRGCQNLIPIARLAAGVPIETASAELRAIVRRQESEYPNDNRGFGAAKLVPLRDLVIGDVGPILMALLAGAGLLLLISCVNVGALVLARSDKRQREIAVRIALGASPSRLLRQFAIEGFVLAALAGVFALLGSAASLRMLPAVMPIGKIEAMPYFEGLHLNILGVIFCCAVSLVASVLFTVVPVMRVSPFAMAEGLKQGSRGNAGTSWIRFGSTLVTTEIALAMILMVVACLLGRSFYILLHLDLGFRADRLAAVQTSWAPNQYSDDRKMIVLGRKIIRLVSELPGVKSVAITNAPPVDSAWGMGSFHVVGRPNHGETNEALNRHVSAGYFSTLQARLIRGRFFDEREDNSKPPVVVVNRTLASKYFPGENAVGRQIYWDGQPKSPSQIIGIVDDIKEGPLADPNWSAVYVPYDQVPWSWPAVLVRSSQTESTLFPDITRAIHSIDPFISVYQSQTMTKRVDESPSAFLHATAAGLLGTFAIVAFVLSFVGLYAVVAYSVAQRTRELGIRIALGAERAAVERLVLTEACRVGALGIAFGMALSLPAARLMRALLFGVRSWDIPTFMIVTGALMVASLLAAYIPARRAASVSPIEALRTE